MTKEIVAAFDFDGTLTKRDTFFPFGLFIAGPRKWLKNLLILIPSGTQFLFRRITRQDLKEKALTLFLQGIPYHKLETAGQEFAEAIIPKLLKPKAIKYLHWHQQQGHRIILISASPEVYLHPWAKIMGIDDVIASRLELDEQGRVTGKLIGANCRCEEKVRRLKELMGEEKDYHLYAYGDSRGDRELLSYADQSYFRLFSNS